MATPTTAVNEVAGLTGQLHPPAEAYELDDTNVRVDQLRRALEVRDESRALIQQVLEEALAPFHYGLRDIERRLDAVERRAPQPLSPGPQVVAAPVAPVVVHQVAQAPQLVQAPQPIRSLPQAAAAPMIMAAAQGDPFTYRADLNSPQFPIPAPPRLPSFDYVVPFDGARRQRRIVMLFALILTLIFGALFAALIWSHFR